MDTALTQKFPFILDRNLAEAKSTETHICTTCDIVVLAIRIRIDAKQLLATNLN